MTKSEIAALKKSTLQLFKGDDITSAMAKVIVIRLGNHPINYNVVIAETRDSFSMTPASAKKLINDLIYRDVINIKTRLGEYSWNTKVQIELTSFGQEILEEVKR